MKKGKFFELIISILLLSLTFSCIDGSSSQNKNQRNSNNDNKFNKSSSISTIDISPKIVELTAVSSTSVEIHWLPAHSKDGIKEYKIYGSPSKGENIESYQLLGTFPSNRTFAKLENLQKGKTYYFFIKAISKNGNFRLSKVNKVTLFKEDPKPNIKIKSIKIHRNAENININSKNLIATTEEIEAGNILSVIDDESGKYKLLKIKEVSTEGNIRKAIVEEVAITDVFDNFSLSVSLNMVDLPDNQENSKASINTLSIKEKDGKVIKRYEWDSDFLMEESYENLIKDNKKHNIRKQDTNIEETNKEFVFKASNGTVRAEITIPKIVRPGQELKTLINAFSEKEINTEYLRIGPNKPIYPLICKVELRRKTPSEKEIEKAKDVVGNFSLNEPTIIKGIQGDKYIYWKPQESDLFSEFRYDVILYFGTTDKCDYSDSFGEKVVIKNVLISSGETHKEKLFKIGKNKSFSAYLKTSDFEPQVNIYANKNQKLFKLNLEAHPRIYIGTTINSQNEFKKTFGPTPFFTKKIRKIFFISGVPIVLSTRFRLMGTMTVETNGEFHGEVLINPAIDLGFEAKWEGGNLSKSFIDPNPRVITKVIANGNQHLKITLHLYPILEVALYDNVRASAVLDPYIYGDGTVVVDAGFVNTSGLYFNPDTEFNFEKFENYSYTDIYGGVWFNKLSFGAGLNSYLYAGAKFLFIDVSYPMDAIYASDVLPLPDASFKNPKHRMYLKAYYTAILGYDDIVDPDNFKNTFNKYDKLRNLFSDDYKGYKKFNIFNKEILALPTIGVNLDKTAKPPKDIPSTAIKFSYNCSNNAIIGNKCEHVSVVSRVNVQDIVKDGNDYWIIPRLSSITETNNKLSVKLKNYINDIPLQAKIAETEISFKNIKGKNIKVPKYWIERYQITDINADDDKDGFSNLDEFLAQTDPTDNLSAPAPYIKTIGTKISILVPVIDLENIYIKEGQQLKLVVQVITPKKENGSIEISSPDGNVISACSLTKGGIIGFSNIEKECKVSFTPTKEGFYKFSLIVNNKKIQDRYLYVYLTPEDKTPPVITLKGKNPLYLTVGDSYKEPGYIANDDVDGNITDKVSVNYGNLDTDKKGTYKIIYSVKDSSGNESKTERTVIVKQKVNNPPEILKITQDTTINLGEGIKLNVTAKDPDGDSIFIYWKSGDNIIKQCQRKICSIFVSPTKTTSYKAVVEDINGASTDKLVNITVKEAEIPTLEINASISPSDVSLVEGEKINVSLSLNVNTSNINGLKCYYEFKGIKKTINCNSTTQIEVSSSDKGSHIISVYAIGTTSSGKSIYASKTLTFNIYTKNRSYVLSFVNENYKDGLTIDINDSISSIDKKWTLKMSDTHSAILYIEEDKSKPCNLTIKTLPSSIIATKGQNFDVNVSFNKPDSAGDFECYFKIKDKDGNYYKIGNTNNIWIKIKVISNDLIAHVNTNTKVVKPNENLYLIVDIQDGNPPYNLTINWGDGSSNSYTIDSNSATYSHSYSSTGNYQISVTLVDKANKLYENSIDISVSEKIIKTSWYGKVDINEDVTKSVNANINVVEKTTSNGTKYYEYNLSYIPPSDKVYYFGYYLPVPEGVLNLNNGKVRLTFVTKTGGIKYYDREFWISTESKKFGIVAINEGYHRELGTDKSYGLIISKDLASGSVYKDYQPALSDKVGAYTVSRYSVEVDSNSLTVYRYEKDATGNYTNKKLISKSDYIGNSLREIGVNLKGNGKIIVVVLEYDEDRDGKFEKKFVLTKKDKTVNWDNIVETNTDIDKKPQDYTNIVFGKVEGIDIDDKTKIRIVPENHWIEGDYRGIVCDINDTDTIGLFGERCILYAEESDFNSETHCQVIVFEDKNHSWRFEKEEEDEVKLSTIINCAQIKDIVLKPEGFNVQEGSYGNYSYITNGTVAIQNLQIDDLTKIRIVPDSHWSDWNGIICDIDENNKWGSSCRLEINENELQSGTCQIIVFTDSDGDWEMEANEDQLFYLETSCNNIRNLYLDGSEGILLNNTTDNNNSSNNQECIITSSGKIAYINGSIELDSYQYIPQSVYIPNENTCWRDGEIATIKWDNTKLNNGDKVMILILYDNPININDNDPDVCVIASKNWSVKFTNLDNTGEYSFDAKLLGGYGNAYKILIITNHGEWGMSQGLFSLNICD